MHCPRFDRLSGRWIVTVAAILAVFAPMTASADTQDADTLTAYDVAKIRTVIDAEMSPDGQHIAYVLAVPRTPFEDEDGGAWRELHVTDVDGRARPYVTGEVSVGSVQWTPDGKGISFLAKRGKDEHRSLYVIPLDGGEARNVLSFDTDISSYSWNPDGAEVAFLATKKEDKDKKELEDEGFNQEIYEEDLNPVHVWISKVDDKDAEPRMLELEGSASELHWSPKGNRLAVALAPTPLIDDFYMKRRVHVVDAATGDVVANLKNPGKMGKVAWSPDGEHVAMISGADLNDPSEGRLMVASYAGGDLKDIMPGYKGHVSDIAWQDDNTIMFIGDEGVETAFGEIALNGDNKVVHVPVGGPIMLGLSLSADGKSAAMTAQTPEFPTEVFVSSHTAKEPRRLTDSNPWLADKRLAKQEVIKYKARDGLELEGMLIHPLDEKQGQRYPLILSIHGGPESHYHNGWLTRYASPGQAAAAEGFAVFYPNYRGSTGRGVEFSKTSQADPAGKEFDDYVDSIDHLVDMGLVDKDKVGITGGSYGGYASAWGATYYTDRFAAAVMFAGISDKISKTGTTDIPEEEFLVHARRRPWDNWQLYLERSPFYYATQCHTPLLILHGKDDPRVHPSQPMELYRFVKLSTDTPVRLVWYPGEGHGNRRAASRLDYNLRMLRWFRHFLQDGGKAAPPYTLEYERPKKDDEEDAEDGKAQDESTSDE